MRQLVLMLMDAVLCCVLLCGADDLMQLPADDHSRRLVKDFQQAYKEKWVGRLLAETSLTKTSTH